MAITLTRPIDQQQIEQELMDEIDSPRDFAGGLHTLLQTGRPECCMADPSERDINAWAFELVHLKQVSAADPALLRLVDNAINQVQVINDQTEKLRTQGLELIAYLEEHYEPRNIAST